MSTTGTCEAIARVSAGVLGDAADEEVFKCVGMGRVKLLPSIGATFTDLEWAMSAETGVLSSFPGETCTLMLAGENRPPVGE